MVKRYTRAEEAAPAAGAAATAAPTAPVALPSWLLTPAQPERSAESLLRPSDPADSEGHQVRTAESLMQRARALQRGTLVHRLLQSLPEIAARNDAATPRWPISSATPAAGPRKNSRRWRTARWR